MQKTTRRSLLSYLASLPLVGSVFATANAREQICGGINGMLANNEFDEAAAKITKIAEVQAEIRKSLEPADELAATQRLLAVRSKLQEIVETEGIDKGVVLLSHDGPTHWDEQAKCHVYEHENFSPLGDALIELYELARPDEEPADYYGLSPELRKKLVVVVEGGSIPRPESINFYPGANGPVANIRPAVAPLDHKGVWFDVLPNVAEVFPEVYPRYDMFGVMQSVHVGTVEQLVDLYRNQLSQAVTLLYHEDSAKHYGEALQQASDKIAEQLAPLLPGPYRFASQQEAITVPMMPDNYPIVTAFNERRERFHTAEAEPLVGFCMQVLCMTHDGTTHVVQTPTYHNKTGKIGITAQLLGGVRELVNEMVNTGLCK
jgi:hypothetical protein